MLSLFNFILRNINIALLIFYFMIIPLVLFAVLSILITNKIGDNHIAFIISAFVVNILQLNMLSIYIIRKIIEIKKLIEKK